MIKINLLSQKKPFRLPLILGVDLNTIKIRWLLIAILINQFSSYFTVDSWKKIETQESDKVQKLEVTLKNLRDDIKAHGSMKEKLQAFQDQVIKLQARSEQVDKILKSKKNPRQVLERLARNLPEDLWFETLEISRSNDLKIGGKSISYKSIGDFIMMANESPFFGSQLTITKSSTQEESEGGFTRRVESFEIQGKIQTYDPWGGK